MEPTTDRSTDVAPGNRGWKTAVAILAVVVVLLGLFILTDDDDGDDGEEVATDATTTTETADRTTTTASTATTDDNAGGGDDDDLSNAESATVVWPAPGDATFDDPVDAASSFAEDLAGFTDPIVGEFQEGDSRSGEVEVQAKDEGPVTTVLVRRLGDGNWYVIGATTPDIELNDPESGDTASSPVMLRGRARAFEGTVQVSVFALGSDDPLGEGFVTGSGGGDLGPFEDEIDFDDPPAGRNHGVLLLHVESAEDGRVWQAAAIPIRLR